MLHRHTIQISAALIVALAFFVATSESAHAEHQGIVDIARPEIFFCYDGSKDLINKYISSNDNPNIEIELIVRDDHRLQSIWYTDDSPNAVDVTVSDRLSTRNLHTTHVYAPGIYKLGANATDSSPGTPGVSEGMNSDNRVSNGPVYLNITAPATITINTVAIGHDGGRLLCPDTIPPEITIKSSSIKGTPGTTFRFSADAADNIGPISSIVWHANGIEVGKGSTFTSQFQTGTHIITATANDTQPGEYGAYLYQNSKKSNAITITVSDPPPPPPPRDNIDPNVEITITPRSGDTTDTFTLSAVATDASGITKIEWYDGDKILRTSPYSGQMRVTDEFRRSFTEGVHNIKAIATDASSLRNEGESGVTSITIGPPPDTADPTVTLSASHHNGDATTPITLTATAQDESGIASIRWLNGTDTIRIDPITTSGSAATAILVTTFPAGVHKITAEATDASPQQNTRRSNTIQVVIDAPQPPPDTKDPQVSLATTHNSGDTTTDITLTATAQDESGIAKIEWFDNDKRFETYQAKGNPQETHKIKVTLTQGTHNIRVLATDASPNANQRYSNTQTIIITPPPDVTKPIVTLKESQSSGDTTAIITFTVMAQDDSGIASVVWYDGDTEIKRTIVSGSPTAYTDTLQSAFEEGTRNIKVTVTDASQNQNHISKTSQITINAPPDNTGPRITLVGSSQVTANITNIIILQATIEDGSGISTITWHNGTHILKTENIPGSPTRYDANLTTAFPQGTHNIELNATDASSNSNPSPVSARWNVFINTPTPPDKDGPLITLTAVQAGDYNRTALRVVADDPSGIATIEWIDGGGNVIESRTYDGTGTHISDTHFETLDDGTHNIHARVTDASSNSNIRNSNTVTVEIIPPPALSPGNTPPRITIPQDQTTITIERSHTQYTMQQANAGIQCTDDDDAAPILTNNATGVNVAIVGTYTIQYSCVDNAQAQAINVTRTVEVVDTSSPIIHVAGQLAVEQGEQYDPNQGVTCTDVGMTVLTNNATNADLENMPGVHTIEYRCTDDVGLVQIEYRTITVTRAPDVGDNAGDSAGGDNTGSDSAGGDNTGSDSAGGDNTGSDSAGGDNTSPITTRGTVCRN